MNAVRTESLMPYCGEESAPASRGHAYSYSCGCYSCGKQEEADEIRDAMRDSAVAELLADKSWRDANRSAAEEWVAGSHSSEHYAELTLALDALHREGLTASVLLRLHQLAKVESLALDTALKDTAEAEVDGRREAA